MTNFHFLLSAWIAVWAVFFLYQVSIASRVARLRAEIEHLKQQIRQD
jgi:hypothetical protein